MDHSQCRAAMLVALASALTPAIAGVRADIKQGMLPDTGARLAAVALDSGDVFGARGQLSGKNEVANLEVVYSGVVRVDGAEWIRLAFDDVALAAGDADTRASALRLTSLKDGGVQHLEMKHVQQWSYTSAYFNGDAVLVELLAAPDAIPAANRVVISEVAIGEPPRDDRSICGPTDDRTLSNDPRAGRIMPIGCTAWLFNNQKNGLLTAGHCGPTGSYVIQFNVPLSSASGTPQNPPPEDQYVVDPASIQSNGGLGVGNDWSYFGVFNNSNTGLNPRDAQGGQTYTLAAAIPPSDARPIRVTGFGSTTSPVPASWYLAQKTHSGPFAGLSSSTIRYSPDTTGGNSGSAVVDDTTGLAIGIHTHAGCTSTGGANQGTAITFGPLQTALANPTGINDQPSLTLGFPAGVPATVSPAGGSTITVSIASDDGSVGVVPGSATLHVNTGSGFASYTMASVGGGNFEGTFPAADCGSAVLYYVSAESTDGEVLTLPFGGAASALTALAADATDVFANDSFQTDTGWSVANNTSLTAGAWVRATPGDYGYYDPPADFDGSGVCYVTGAGNIDDVDGGPTRLTSPAYDLSGASAPVLSYARWFNASRTDDWFRVEFSSDNGATWTLVENVARSDQWAQVSLPIADFVPLTNAFRVRFSVSDNPNNSICEGAVDALQILDLDCGSDCPDLNGDGVIDFGDVSAFATLFAAQDSGADINGDGVVDFGDVSDFATQFSACQ